MHRPSRGLLHDCKTLRNLLQPSFQALPVTRPRDVGGAAAGAGLALAPGQPLPLLQAARGHAQAARLPALRVHTLPQQGEQQSTTIVN